MSEDQTILTSVIIVNYNAGSLLTECVQSVFQSSVPVEVILLDNGSTDRSIRSLRKTINANHKIQIIENDENLGFPKANNIGIRLSRGKFLLFLNPDCIIKPDTIANMLEGVLQDPDVGMAGCLIQNPDGTEQPGCRRTIPTPKRAFLRMSKLSYFFSNRKWFDDYILTKYPLPEKPIYVEAISGAFMFVKKSAMRTVGDLDEGYFLHCEDLDWCMRFRGAGWKILFIPNSPVVHFKGGCSKDTPIAVLWYKHKGMVRFYWKFFRSRYSIFLLIPVMLGIWLRFSLLTAGVLLQGNSKDSDEDTPSLTTNNNTAGSFSPDNQQSFRPFNRAKYK